MEDSDINVIQSTRFYSPPSDYSWAADLPITHCKQLRTLYNDERCKTTLERGLLGLNVFTFVRRRWNRPTKLSEGGLLSELKLFTSETGLRRWQGQLVPKLVNVYNDQDTVSLLFEPPHHSFWMHASADMPYILKKQVVLVYLTLHSRGILHGSPELHNILIAGDCQIRLMDFSRARAKVPIPAVGIGKAHKKDFEFEMREVMFKLDYEGARRREGARMDRVEAMRKRNKAREELRDLRKKGIVEGPVEADEWLTQADHAELPPHPIEYNRWVESLEIPPSPRIVVPGQSEEQLQAAEEEFKACLKHLEDEYQCEATAPLLLRTDDHPLPLPLKILTHETILKNERKRKASSEEPEDSRTAKRPRTSEASATSEGSAPAPQPTSDQVVYEYTSKSYSTGTSDVLLPAASCSNSSNPDPPSVKVRDFASEPYHGPRGFYVPYPPYEYMMTANRLAHILSENAVQCGHLGLPYFREDNADMLPPHYKRHVFSSFSKSLGTLKRNRAAAEGTAPATHEEQRAAKRQRYLEERAGFVAVAENRTVRFSERLSYAEPPTFSGGRRISEPEWEYNQYTRPRRSSLKRSRAVRTVSYDLKDWLSTGNPDSSSNSSPSKSSNVLSPPPTQGTWNGESTDASATPGAGSSIEYRRTDEPGVCDVSTRQVAVDPPEGATNDPGETQMKYGPYLLRRMRYAPGRRTGIRIAPALLDTVEEADEAEVRRILLDLPPSAGQERGTREWKTIMDNVCLWLERREEPDGTDIWDE